MESGSINFVGFNQDYHCILLGHNLGYSFYDIDNDRVYEKESNKTCPIMKIGRLYNSSLIVYVSTEDPRRLTLFHHKKGTVIIEVKFSNAILAVKLNRKVVIACTEDGIYIYDTESMKRKHKIEVIPINRAGIFALTVCDNSILAYPSSNKSGNIHVFNIAEMKNVVILEAHQGVIAALEFNHDGSLLATASDKGTVIRIFTIPTGDKFCEFRRGFARCATISCLSFSLDSQFVLACSNTETVHVFNLFQMSNDHHHQGENYAHYSSLSSIKDETPPLPGSPSQAHKQTSNTATSWLLGYVGSALKATSPYLPYPAQQVTEMLSQDRCFSVARLPPIGTSSSTLPASTSHTDPLHHQSGPMAGAVSSFDSKLSMRKVGAVIKYEHGWRIVVGTFDGYIYVFKFDPRAGGEAELVTTYDLVNGKHLIKNVRMTQGIDSSPVMNTASTSNNRTRSLSIADPYSISSQQQYNHHPHQHQHQSNLTGLSAGNRSSFIDAANTNRNANNKAGISMNYNTMENPNIDTLNITDENEFPPIK